MAKEIKNLKKTAVRISKAVKNKENIIIYGDADLDGTASVIILQETIKNLGGEAEKIYFPDRETEGYGLNKKAISSFKKFAPGLLITVDCGITNFEEVDFAKKIGLEVIIVDHHEPLDRLPKASIIVDPKQKGDKYHFKVFAAAGIVFKLAKEILGKKMTESIELNFLELAGLATIADMMPQKDENFDIIQKGMRSLPSSWRPGIRAFFEIKEINDRSFEREIVSKIIFLLNVRDVANEMPSAYRVLTSPSVSDAKIIIENLFKKRALKKEEVGLMVEEIEKEIEKVPEEKIVFQECSSSELNFLGSLASIICNKYQKPTFIFRKKKGEYQGAVRMPSGLNGVEAMKSCSDILITYGGHPAAGGFKIKSKNIKKFKECLIKYFSI